MSVTKPLCLDETLQDVADAIRGVSLGNYVIVNINNYTWGSVAGAGVYPNNTPVTLHATPAEDCYFLCWRNANGDILSVEPSYTFTPSGNTVIQADFNADEYVKIVSWANGTDVELSAMLDAHDRGVIDIYDYWSVGDTRTVRMTIPADSNYAAQPAQDVELTLMEDTASGDFTLTETDATFHFIVGMKNCFSNSFKLDVSNSYTWWNSTLRDWANDTVLNSLETTLKSMLKSFTWTVDAGKAGSKTITDTLSVADTYMVALGGSHNKFEFYTNAENRIKYVNDNAVAYWASNSPGNYSSQNSYFFSTMGELSINLSGGNEYVSLFGII